MAMSSTISSARSLDSDPLRRLIRKTCYVDFASEIADLMRKTIQTYKEEDADVEGLSDHVFSVVPTGHRVGTSGGIHPVYAVQTSSHRYRCVWRELLAKGAYNHVFYADLEEEDGTETAAVIKITIQSDKDLRVYLLENVIHALLYAHPGTHDLVVPMRIAFKIRRTGFPPYKLGTVMNDPGQGDLGGWIESTMKNDEEMFAALTQIAWVMYQAQKAAKVEHRDLKCDNIMVEDNPHDAIQVDMDDGESFVFPSVHIRLLLIDFGMTRLEIEGEYIACDCMHTDRQFNPSHDMQNLLCTMHEDYQDCFQDRAPRFGKWVAEQVKPLMRTVKKYWPRYHDASAEEKHEKLSFVVCTERIPGFTPQAMLQTLGKTYWKRRTSRTRTK